MNQVKSMKIWKCVFLSGPCHLRSCLCQLPPFFFKQHPFEPQPFAFVKISTPTVFSSFNEVKRWFKWEPPGLTCSLPGCVISAKCLYLSVSAFHHVSQASPSPAHRFAECSQLGTALSLTSRCQRLPWSLLFITAESS